MKINLIPVGGLPDLVLHRAGDTLMVNGEAFDFSPLAEGDVLPAEAISSPWFGGPVTRTGGELELTLTLPLPVNFSQAQAFPEPVVVAGDGPIALPSPEVLEEPTV